VVVFKLGSWVGAGLVSGGRLHRGAQGCAGSLVTTAGGEAIAREAQRLAASGASPGLADALRTGKVVDARLVSELAGTGDQECRTLLDRAAEDIGRVMAVVVDFFNPSLVVVAGGVTHRGDAFLAKVRETVYGSALALATRDLRIVRSTLDVQAGVIGAALMTLDELFAADRLPRTLAVVRSDGARP
jgi:predicted NBD/HSP70 family sugar kinase